jgi:hypothetical protein
MRTPSTRLSVEPLEGREVPANVVTAVSGNTLFILGTTQSDSITLSQSAPGQLTITPGAGSTINGSAGPVTGVLSTNLVIRLGSGDDNLAFDLSTGLRVAGSLVVDYGTAGTGTKTTETVNAGQFGLSVGGGLGIRYAAGDVSTTLDNLAVAGGVTVRHAAGDSTLTIDALAGAGHFSSIGGSLMVMNTRGVANNTLSDTNVAGNVQFINGLARASDNAAGSTNIKNVQNTTRATIGGSLAISNLSGDSATGDAVGDVIVRGSVGMFLGGGQFSATVANVTATGVPVSIGGSLGIRGAATGQDTITLGAAGTGLRVGMNLAVTAGSRDATLTINDVTVLGATSLFTGAGADTISIDGASGAVGSTFTGGFALGTGPGADTVLIGSGAGTGSTTHFRGAVGVSLGRDDDTLRVGNAAHVQFNTPAALPVVFNGSLGTNTKSVTTGNVSGHPQSYPNFS